MNDVPLQPCTVLQDKPYTQPHKPSFAEMKSKLDNLEGEGTTNNLHSL